MLAGMLTGCMGQQMNVNINADGTCGYTMKYLYEQSMYDSMTSSGDTSSSALNSGDFEKKTETIDSKIYYSFSRNFSFTSLDAMKSFLTDDTTYYNTLVTGSKNPSAYTKESFLAPFSDVTVDASAFRGVLSQDSMLSSSAQPKENVTPVTSKDSKSMDGYKSINEYYKANGMIVDIAVTLPAAITESNGTINGNTATWDITAIPDDGCLIAVTSGNPISGDTTAPVVSGVKKNGLYKKATVKITDDVCVNRVTVNGIRYNSSRYLFAQSGTYTIVATDANSNTTTVKFSVDAKAPVIKGLKSGKVAKKGVTLRFSDNKGVQSVKINGKSASKKKVRLNKVGKYVIKVTDKAGNVTKTSFRIVER